MELEQHLNDTRPDDALATGHIDDAYDYGPAPLLLATRSIVWTSQPGTQSLSEMQTDAKPQDHPGHAVRPCMFCELDSGCNEVHHINDNHLDTRPENLGAACALCHRWQHLGDLGDGEAYLCYLPDLTPQDANHLLRTLLVALTSDDASAREDAHALLNWMASHRDYVKQAWGTWEPGVFAQALLRQSADEKEWREISFADLALVVRPGSIAGAVTHWNAATYAGLPACEWPRVHHGIMNAPL